jgi:hypothetical protein
MRKRLQVLIPDREISDIERVAKRGALPDDLKAKLKAVRRAVRYTFPTADIGQMLSEIERRHEA